MSQDSNRTRIWFPMFSYFESSVDGIIPNEYDSIDMVFENILSWILYIKDCCMLTARRFWIAQNQFTPLPKNLLVRPNTNSTENFISQNINNLLLNKTNAQKLKDIGQINLLNAEQKSEIDENIVAETSTAAPQINCEISSSSEKDTTDLDDMSDLPKTPSKQPEQQQQQQQHDDEPLLPTQNSTKKDI